MWLFGGKVDRKKIDEDEQKLYAYYRGLGFFTAKIGHELDYNESKTWLTLRFIINEGPRYSIRNVSFIGNEHFKVGQLNKNLQQIAGKPFDQSALDHDLGGVRDVYGCHGYVFADIQHDVRLSEDKPELDLVYNIAEGKQYRVGHININIAGDDPHTAHATILDRMSLRPGDIVDTKKLREDERRLKFSSIFNTDPTKGGPPKIAFVKSGDKDDSDTADSSSDDSSNSKKGGRHSSDNYRGQSPDTEVLDVYPARDAQGNDVAVFVPQSNPRGRILPAGNPQVRFQSPGPDNWGGYSNSPSASDAQRAWGLPPGSSTPSYLPPGARPLPPYSVTSAPGFGAPPVGAAPNATSPYSNAAFQAPAAVNGAPTDPTASVAPPVYGCPPHARLRCARLRDTAGVRSACCCTAGNLRASRPAAGLCSRSGRPAGLWTADREPYVQAPPSNILPPPGPAGPGGVGADIFGQPENAVDLNINAAETMTGRLMLGVGVNSDAGLVGNFVLDEQNFDITRLPRSWEDIRDGAGLARRRRTVAHRSQSRNVGAAICNHVSDSLFEPHAGAVGGVGILLHTNL